MARPELRQSGTWAVLASAVLFGTTGTVLVNAPSSADAYSVGALRLLVGGVTLAVIAWRTGAAVERSTGRARPSALAAVGAVGVGVFQLGYFLSVERTGVAVGTVVTIGSGPVISGVAHAVRAQRMPPTLWTLGTCCGVAGVALLGLAGREGTADALGIVLAIAAGSGWATFASVGRHEISRGVDSTLNMALMFCGGALLMTPLLLWHSPRWVLDPSGMLVALYLGVLTVGLAYWLYGVALRSLPAPTVITLTLLEPITAATLGAIVVNESIAAAGWMGVGLVVTGLLVTGRSAMASSRDAQRPGAPVAAANAQ